VRTRRSLTQVRLLAAGVAAALAAALTAGLSSLPASAAAPASPAVVAMQRSWSSVPDYLSSLALARGEVVSPHGAAVSGATVLLFPVPLAGKTGTVMRPLSRAVTDAAGNFVLHLPVTRNTMLANKRDTPGVVNVHIIAFYPGGMANWFEPVHVGQVAAGTRLVMHPERVTSVRSVNTPAICVQGTQRIYGGIPTVMGYKSNANAWLQYATFSYDTSTSTTLGAAASLTGFQVGFTEDGSTTQSDGGNNQWPNYSGRGNNYFEGDAAYYDTAWGCNPGGAFWELTQDGVGGDAGTPGAPSVNAGDCDSSGIGFKAQIKTSRQVTFGAGVDTKYDGFNINLSAQAGWDSDTVLTYKWASVTSAYCGVGNYPGDAGSDYVQVHAPG
jgi:hypothetical protein